MKKGVCFYAIQMILGVILFSSVVSAQSAAEVRKICSSDFAVNNLTKGINSDNLGLCKSCIYYAGYYKIQRCVKPLTRILGNTSIEANVRKLAAVCLFRIGDRKGINAIRDTALFEKDDRLKNFCSALYEAYVNGDYQLVMSM